MKISGNLDIAKSQLLEEIRLLQQKKAEELKELQIVRNEIADQRAGKAIVYSETVKLEKEAYDLENMIGHLRQLSNKEQIDFYKMTAKQREELIKLSKLLEQKISGREEYKEKEKNMINIDAVNRLHKEHVTELNVELKRKQWELADADRQKNEVIKSKEIFVRDLELKEKFIKEREEKVTRREKNQELRERRWEETKNWRKKFINLKKK